MAARSTLAMVLGTAALTCPAWAHDDGTPIPEQLILVTNPGVTLDDVRAAHPGLTLVDLRRFSPARIHLVQVPPDSEGVYEAELAADTALVRSAEQNKTVASPEEGTTQSLFLRSQRAGFATQAAFADINGPAMGRSSSGAESPILTIVYGILAPSLLRGREIVPRI